MCHTAYILVLSLRPTIAASLAALSDQLKLLEQNDTENIIQQALGKSLGYDLSISESVGQDSHGKLLDEILVEERGRNSVENEQKDSHGESVLNKIALVPEGLDKKNVSGKMLQEENNCESVLDENAIMCGCGNAFDLMERCVAAGRDSCVTAGLAMDCRVSLRWHLCCGCSNSKPRPVLDFSSKKSGVIFFNFFEKSKNVLLRPKTMFSAIFAKNAKNIVFGRTSSFFEFSLKPPKYLFWSNELSFLICLKKMTSDFLDEKSKTGLGFEIGQPQ